MYRNQTSESEFAFNIDYSQIPAVPLMCAARSLPHLIYLFLTNGRLALIVTVIRVFLLWRRRRALT